MSIVTKIAEKVGEILELDQYSLVNGLARSVRIKINFELNRELIPSVRIPLNG